MGVSQPPPTLPPRRQMSSPSSFSGEHLPPYEPMISSEMQPDEDWARRDPRSSSQQSLVPEPGQQKERRKLLLIYIHGFMGNETSFRSFPAHVHNLLAVLLADTHVVHTKLYPRYRSKRNITFARDDFSKWLDPHEDDTTDVILLGHSMGGLLAAEVVLDQSHSISNLALRHRILGTINFDVPFLGMHPGIVKSGLASIFSADETPGDKYSSSSDRVEGADVSISGGTPEISSSSSSDILWSKQDPNFNPSFANDVVLPVRKGWRSAWHFVNKHSDDLRKATKQLVSSHMEFGGAMANLNELKRRYVQIRALEEEDSRIRSSVTRGDSVPPRVRFVNYYTASTGRPKRQRPPENKLDDVASSSRRSTGLPDTDVSASSDQHRSLPDSTAESSSQALDDAMATMTIIGPSTGNRVSKDIDGSSKQLPHPPEVSSESFDIPILPVKPPPLDVSYIQDQHVRELIAREHTKAVQAYEEALRRREEDLNSKQDRDATQQRATKPGPSAQTNKKPEGKMSHREKEEFRLDKERQRMAAEARRMRGEKEPENAADEQKSSEPVSVDNRRGEASASESLETPALTPSTSATASERQVDENKQKPIKDRKFCTLPPKDSNGERDPCWVRIYMEGVDEVGAHCGLFFVDERYERLVGEVAERIELWVHENPDESAGFHVKS